MKKSLGKNILFVIALLISFVLIAVSCPNNTIQGSVDRDGRNNAKIMITGTINAPLTDSRKFTVTLNNATFRAYSRGEDVSSWFVDENGEPFTIDGLKYRIASPVARGSNKATIRITGTPTEASKKQIHLLIPCDTFQGPININVDTEDALFYNIIDYIEPTLVLVQEEGNDMLIEAMEGKPFDKTIKFALDHAYFAGSLSKTAIDVTTDGGDGSIINASSGGGKLDPSTTNPFTYTWKIGDTKEGEEHSTEILLNIKGTADKKRNAENGDTFAVTLLPSYYTEEDSSNEVLATIYDDFGNPYTKALSIKGTGEYRFTELKPTLKFVDVAPAFTGVADDTYAKAFEEQSLTFRIYDGKLSTDSYNVSGASKAESDSDTVLKAANFFTDEYTEVGLDFIIACTSGSSSIPNGTDEFGPYFEYKLTAKKATDSSRKLTEFEKELPLQFNVGLVKKYINNSVGSDYDEVLVSDKNVSFAISKNQPLFTKKAFIQGMAEVALETQTATLTIDNGFFFKATDTEEKPIDENSLVKISPMKDALVYSYKIEADASTPNKSKSIQIIVKQGDEKEDEGTEDEDLLTIHAAEITVPAKSTSNPASYADSVFKQDKLDLAQIEVTFDPSMFVSEAETDLDADITSVVIKKGSNVLRYAIYPLDLSLSVPTLSAMETNDGTRYEDSNLINKTIDIYGDISYGSYGVESGYKELNYYPLVAGIKPPTFNKLKKEYHDTKNDKDTTMKHSEFQSYVKGKYAYDYYNALINGTAGTSGYMTIYNDGSTNLNDVVLDEDLPYETISAFKRYMSDYNVIDDIEKNNTESYALPLFEEGHIVPREFFVPIMLPKNYDLTTDFDAANDITIYNSFKTAFDSNQNDIVPVQLDDKVLDVANKHIKFGLRRTDLMPLNRSVPDADKDDTIGTNKPNPNFKIYFAYIREFPDTDAEKAAFIDDLKAIGVTQSPLDLYSMDIRLNPSKIVTTDSDGKSVLLLSKKKSKDKGNWFKPVGEHISVYDDQSSFEMLYEYYTSGSSLRISFDNNSDKYYWRIMDRATYAPITADIADYESDHPYASLTRHLMHSVHSVSANADFTTTIGGESPLKIGSDIGNTAGSANTGFDDKTTTIIEVKELDKINPRTGMKFESAGLYPAGGVPMFELASGNTRTIPASTLNEVFSLKRKGYLPAGLAKGMNNHKYNGAFHKYQNIGQSLSDTIIYKGYSEYLDEGGNSVIDDYSVDTLNGEDLILPTYEARGYHNFQNVKDFSVGRYEFTDKIYADWNNTTYLYLVWKKNPESAYYNVWTANKGTPSEGQVQKPVGDVNFVTIPGDLNWLTYKTPKYIDSNGDIAYFSKNGFPKVSLEQSDFSGKYTETDYLKYYYAIDKISSDKKDLNDYVIADRELPGSLWKTVYEWATSDERGAKKYDFGVYDKASTSSQKVSYETNVKYSSSIYRANGPYFWYREDNSTVSPIISGGESTLKPLFGVKYGTNGNYYYISRNDLNHPVVGVNLYDAMLFCNALTEWYNANQGGDLTLAYGENRTYTDIKSNLQSYIYDSVNKTGFRLPTYSEWFAAATIVPTVDNFIEAQGLNGSAINNYKTACSLSRNENYLGPRQQSSSDSLLLQNYFPPVANKEFAYKMNGKNTLDYRSNTYYDTSFPFMQKLNYKFSGDNDDYHYFGLHSGYKLAWYTQLSEHSGTKPVANMTSTEVVGDGSVLYDPTKFIPNSLGIWDMSGNAAEWIISPQESGTTYNVWLIGGDHMGMEEMSYLLQGNPDTNSGNPLKPNYENILLDRVEIDAARVYDPTLPYMYVDSFDKETHTKVEKVNYYQLDVRQRGVNTGFRIARTLPKV